MNRKQSTQDAEEARNQAEADSEVSQINTQPPPAPAANEENIRYSSMSSATPSLRKKGEVAQVIAPYEATSSEQLSLTRGQLIMIRKKTDSGWWEGELQVIFMRIIQPHSESQYFSLTENLGATSKW